jgi:hypothetical protein
MLARVIFLSLMVTLQFDHVVAWLARATTAAALKIKKPVAQPVVALYSTSSKTLGPANGDDLALTVASNNVSFFKQSTDVFSKMK